MKNTTREHSFSSRRSLYRLIVILLWTVGILLSLCMSLCLMRWVILDAVTPKPLTELTEENMPGKFMAICSTGRLVAQPGGSSLLRDHLDEFWYDMPPDNYWLEPQELDGIVAFLRQAIDPLDGIDVKILNQTADKQTVKVTYRSDDDTHVYVYAATADSATPLAYGHFFKSDGFNALIAGLASLVFGVLVLRAIHKLFSAWIRKRERAVML